MACFAQLDENNIVLQVIVIHDDALGNLQFPASEQAGINFCLASNLSGVWKQTSENGEFRRSMAAPGFFYDTAQDKFVPPRPDYPCIFDEVLNDWIEINADQQPPEVV